MSPSTPSTTVPVSTIGQSTYQNNNNNNDLNTGNSIDVIISFEEKESESDVGEEEEKGQVRGRRRRRKGEGGGGGEGEGKGEGEEEGNDEGEGEGGEVGGGGSEEDEMIINANGVKTEMKTSTATSNNNHRHLQSSHQHGIYKPRRHARSKSPALKRVSFGSSKGSMVETLIYDHSEEDLFKDKLTVNGNHNNNERYLNGNHISNYSQPIHFHYPINRRLGSRVASDSTISGSFLLDRPSRVRVSLYESGRPGSIVSPETPEPPSTLNNNFSTISRITANPPSSTSNYTTSSNQYYNNNNINHQQSLFHSQNLTSSASSTTVNNHHNQQNNQHHSNHQHHHPKQDLLTLDLVNMMERKVSVDSGIENPFRPGGELSREAETIVNLIKEGKPITPTTPTKDLSTGGKIVNGISSSTITPTSTSPSNQQYLSPTGKLSPGTGSTTAGRNSLNNIKSKGSNNQSPLSDYKVYPESNNATRKELNGSSKMMINVNGDSPAIVEVERSIVSPTEPPKADIVTIKKNKKCICCTVS